MGAPTVAGATVGLGAGVGVAAGGGRRKIVAPTAAGAAVGLGVGEGLGSGLASGLASVLGLGVGLARMIGRYLIGAAVVWASAEELAASTIKAVAGTASNPNFTTNDRFAIANTPPGGAPGTCGCGRSLRPVTRPRAAKLTGCPQRSSKGLEHN